MKLRGLIPILFALLLPVSSWAADGFLANYRKGLSAVESGRWEEAKRFLEAAVGERPESKPRLTRQAYLKPYLPHYYVGLARFELDDCRGALEAWRESERQGVVAKKPRLEGDLRAKSQRCTSRLAERQRVLNDGVEWVELASKRAAAVGLLARQPGLEAVWSQGRPSLADRLRQSNDLIAAARSRLQPGRADAEYEQAKREARQAFEDLVSLRADAERRMLAAEVVASERAPVEEELAKARAAGRRLLERTATLNGQPAVRARRRDLSGLLDDTEVPVQQLTLAEARAYTRRLSDALDRLGAASRAPSSTLQRAAEAVFDGRFEEAVSLIDAASFQDRRSRSHGQLLRSAAYFNLYLLHGAEDEIELQTAVDAALRAKEAGPSLVLPERSFSPRFIRFFEGISLASATSGR